MILGRVCRAIGWLDVWQYPVAWSTKEQKNSDETSAWLQMDGRHGTGMERGAFIDSLVANMTVSDLG